MVACGGLFAVATGSLFFTTGGLLTGRIPILACGCLFLIGSTRCLLTSGCLLLFAGCDIAFACRLLLALGTGAFLIGTGVLLCRTFGCVWIGLAACNGFAVTSQLFLGVFAASARIFQGSCS